MTLATHHEALTAVLAEHVQPVGGVRPGGSPKCRCGWIGDPSESFTAHLADALLASPVVFDVAALAEDAALVEAVAKSANTFGWNQPLVTYGSTTEQRLDDRRDHLRTEVRAYFRALGAALSQRAQS